MQEISTFPHFCKMEVLRRMLVSLSSSKGLFKNSFLMVKQTKKVNESPYHCDIANRKFFYDNKICKHLCNLLKGRQKTRRATCCTAGQNCSIWSVWKITWMPKWRLDRYSSIQEIVVFSQNQFTHIFFLTHLRHVRTWHSISANENCQTHFWIFHF